MPSPRKSKILNALSVDVEDYFHVEAFATHISPDLWPTYEFRIEQNVDRILDIFSRHRAVGTFFFLGWVAERFPVLLRRIAAAGHEIGCHGYAHQRIHSQTPQQFREDVHAARQCLEAQAQKPIHCYRAPSFSVVDSTLWALDILAEEGFIIDSSIFPVKHDLYGVPDAERFPHWRKDIFEFPLSTYRRGNLNLGVAGGGYLRLIPYSMTRWAVSRINDRECQPVMVYFHPWELDPDQPRISTSVRSRFRHYTNLKRMREKIENLLEDFRFSTVSDVCERLQVYKNRAAEFTENSSTGQSKLTKNP